MTAIIWLFLGLSNLGCALMNLRYKEWLLGTACTFAALISAAFLINEVMAW